MPVTILDNAIQCHPFQPKGIKVSSELWKMLVKQGRITYVRGYLKGVIDSEMDFPVLNGRIFVQVEPELDGFNYELPLSYSCD